MFLYENSAQCSRGMQNQFDLVKARVIGGFELSGVFLYENSAQCSRGMQNQFDLVKVRVIGG